MTAFTLLLALPFAVRAQDGMQMRLDRSTNAADPDDVPEVTMERIEGEGMLVTTGPAVVIWNPDQEGASGSFTFSATFELQTPSDHTNYYGLVYGGGDLDGASQNYLYFLVAQNGMFMVSHRANDDDVHVVQAKTAHDAVATPGSDGQSVNALEVRVGADQTEFVINGTVVHTAPKSGMAARTDGLVGVRINHVIPGVLVSQFSVN
jgi:hypothetical protein